jgi:hypothetical protein
LRSKHLNPVPDLHKQILNISDTIEICRVRDRPDRQRDSGKDRDEDRRRERDRYREKGRNGENRCGRDHDDDRARERVSDRKRQHTLTQRPITERNTRNKEHKNSRKPPLY